MYLIPCPSRVTFARKISVTTLVCLLFLATVGLCWKASTSAKTVWRAVIQEQSMSLLCLYPVTGSTGLCKRNNEDNNAARLDYRTNKRRQLLLQSFLHNLDFTAQCPHSLQLHCQWGEKLFWRSLTIARPRKKPHCTLDCNSKLGRTR